ncbi:MAG TPA: inner membrane CreD family protein [Verrucomicrobiae bacterium]|nr:inner membrane CreD family protein [Verrucomicrobiae bacterium]
MKYKMTMGGMFAVGWIFLCTAAGWFLLGGAVEKRTAAAVQNLGKEVRGAWGPAMAQCHPHAYYLPPGGGQKDGIIRPASSHIAVALSYEPKRKGLLWHRTYGVSFEGEYLIQNPTPIQQTVYVVFRFPSADATYHDFRFSIGDAAPTERAPENGAITESVVIAPNASVPLKVGYRARGVDRWAYAFEDASRVRNFELRMTTDFAEINFPTGTGSPTGRQKTQNGWELTWSYPDVLSAPGIGMDMPNVLNAGPVAARISFFAPVSLLFFFAVLLIVGVVRQQNLHPMNYFFLAAGFFAFQALFTYLVDLVPLHLSFAIAAAVSLLLVCGYIHAVSGGRLSRVAVPAQIAYMVLFSYSFFFDGLSGLTITIGAVGTLALLMALTAHIDWDEKLGKGGSRKKGGQDGIGGPLPVAVPPKLGA